MELREILALFVEEAPSGMEQIDTSRGESTFADICNNTNNQ